MLPNELETPRAKTRIRPQDDADMEEGMERTFCRGPPQGVNLARLAAAVAGFA